MILATSVKLAINLILWHLTFRYYRVMLCFLGYVIFGVFKNIRPAGGLIGKNTVDKGVEKSVDEEGAHNSILPGILTGGSSGGNYVAFKTGEELKIFLLVFPAVRTRGSSA
jgi:hypothetical protein